jgi:hypothetical protein
MCVDAPRAVVPASPLAPGAARESASPPMSAPPANYAPLPLPASTPAPAPGYPPPVAWYPPPAPAYPYAVAPTAVSAATTAWPTSPAAPMGYSIGPSGPKGYPTPTEAETQGNTRRVAALVRCPEIDGGVRGRRTGIGARRRRQRRSNVRGSCSLTPSPSPFGRGGAPGMGAEQRGEAMK